MNDLIKSTNDDENIVELWEKTKRKQAEIDRKANALEEKIEDECNSAWGDARSFYEKELKNSSKNLQRSVQERNDYRAKLSKSAGMVFLYALIIAAVVIIFKILAYDFVIANNFLTYVIIIALSFIISGFIVKYRNVNINKAIALINQKIEVKQFDEKIENCANQKENETNYIRNEKYKSELDEIKALYRENNYDSVRKRMLNYKYKDSVLFYFRKFASNSAYEISIDGVKTFYSQSRQQECARLNPGYHTIELVLISELSDTVYTNTYRFQVGPETLPFFIFCNKVSGHSDGACKEVSAEQFELLSKTKIL